MVLQICNGLNSAVQGMRRLPHACGLVRDSATEHIVLRPLSPASALDRPGGLTTGQAVEAAVDVATTPILRALTREAESKGAMGAEMRLLQQENMRLVRTNRILFGTTGAATGVALFTISCMDRQRKSS